MKAIILLLILLSGCTSQPKQPEVAVNVKSDSANHLKQTLHTQRQQNAPDDSIKRRKQCIELTLSPTVYPKTCDGITTVLTNYSSQPLTFGEEHYFEFNNHGKWERICFDKGDVVYVFNLIGFELPPNTSQFKYYSLNQELHTYVPGKYRIFIPYTIEGNTDNRTVEFTLE